MSNEIISCIDAAQSRFVDVAPKNINFESEKGFAVQILQNNSFLLSAAKSSPQSLQHAVANIAAIGLSLNPAKKQAYLLPRNVKVKDANGRDKYVNKVFLEPSYMGLCDIATMSGEIKWVQAVPVFSGDEYVNHGPGEKPTHNYNAFAKQSERGKFVGAYCIAKLKDGDYLTENMSAEEIDKIAARSESFKKGFGPWKTDYYEMAKKTVVRRAFKMWPKAAFQDGRLQQAIHLSEENEGFEPIHTEPNVTEPSADQKNVFDGLIESNDFLGMYTLKQTLIDGDVSGQGASIWISLCNSFPKGQKGKYGDLVKQLCEEGKNIYDDICIALDEAIDSGDDIAITEVAEDLQQDTLKMIEAQLSVERLHQYKSITNG